MTDAARFLLPHCSQQLRDWIAAAGGVEIFAIGQTDADLVVVALAQHATGNHGAVNAFPERARPGEVLIHNHPSGQLLPSDADLAIAGRAGAAGAGFYIIDNDASAVNAVVLPWRHEHPVPVPADYAEAVFAANGLLAQKLDNFEARPGQLQFAAEAADTLSSGGLAILEAGTGIGKSYAYLAPALKLAQDNDATVVVSTATLALQSQLIDKDVPALERALGQPIRAVVLKGRSNYVSIRRAYEALRSPRQLFPDVDAAAFAALERWLERTNSGERSELGDQIGDDLWELAQSESDNCLRARCPNFNQCHYFNSRRRAASAHLAIVNHALLAADLAIRVEAQLGYNETVLLPPFRHLVVDEAHALEGYARSQFGARLSELAAVRTLGDLARRKGKAGALQRLKNRLLDRAVVFERSQITAWSEQIDVAIQQVEALREPTAAWFALLTDWHEAQAGDGTIRTPAPGEAFAAIADSGCKLADAYVVAADAVTGIFGDAAEDLPPEVYGVWSEVRSRGRRLERYASALRAVLTNRSRNEVAWLERAGRQRRLVLEIAPVDVGRLLNEGLWSRLRAVVLTSATLAAGKQDFSLLKRGLGLQLSRPKERQIPSPFPYDELVVLNLVQGLPSDGGPRFSAWAEAAAALAQASDGSALVLCTSNAAVKALAKALRSDARTAKYKIFAQGEAPVAQLAERFRRDLSSILVGTAAFWEGFDAAGETLRHVIVTKLPFAVPNHPLEQARQDWVREQGGDPFRDLSLPEAVTRFRQGFGRLVRSASDWGAVSILDGRIEAKGYGKKFLAALPAAQVRRGSLAELALALQRWFLERETAQPSA